MQQPLTIGSSPARSRNLWDTSHSMVEQSRPCLCWPHTGRHSCHESRNVPVLSCPKVLSPMCLPSSISNSLAFNLFHDCDGPWALHQIWYTVILLCTSHGFSLLCKWTLAFDYYREQDLIAENLSWNHVFIWRTQFLGADSRLCLCFSQRRLGNRRIID